MLAPSPKPWIMDIAPYVPGRATTDTGKKVAKLSSNENPLGTSEAAREAFRSAADSLDRYPDASGAIVREAIAAAYDLDPARVIYGKHVLGCAVRRPFRGDGREQLRGGGFEGR